MQIDIRAAALALAIGFGPATVHAAPFSDLFVFGDSLSDAGNIFLATGGATQGAPFPLVPNAAYASGRFSDGPVWVEQLAASLGNSAAPSLAGGTNNAFGGARVGTAPVGPPVGIPTLFDQAAGFLLGSGGTVASDALYVIWGGANDTRDAAQLKAAGNDPLASALLQSAAANLAAIVGALATAGATDFLVLNVPNLGLTPEALLGVPGLASASTAAAIEFNTALDAALAPLAANPTLRITGVDVFQLITDAVAAPVAFGLSNATDPCVTGLSVCTDPDQYLFWDGLHPTTAAHALIASAALTALVPEPASLLLVAGGLLLVARRVGARTRRTHGG